MTLLKDFHYKLDTVWLCRQVAERFWQAGRRSDAVSVLRESAEIIRHFSLDVPSELSPEQLDKLVDIFLNTDSKGSTTGSSNISLSTTGVISFSFLRRRSSERTLEKAEKLWQEHNFEGALDLLSFGIERLIAIDDQESEEELDKLIDKARQYRLDWSNYLLDTVETNINALWNGKKPFRQTELLKLERLAVRAFKLAPSEKEGRSGKVLVDMFSMLSVQQRTTDCLKLIENGYLETALRNLETLVKKAPVNTIKKLYDSAKQRREVVERMLSRFDQLIVENEIDRAHVLLESIIKVNREHARLPVLQADDDDYLRIRDLMNKARTSGAVKHLEEALNICRLGLAARSGSGLLPSLIPMISDFWENTIIDKSNIDSEESDRILNLIDQFSRHLPLTTRLEELRIQVSERSRHSQDLVESCRSDIAEFRFAIARTKLNQILRTPGFGDIGESLDSDITQGEQAIAFYRQAREAINKNDLRAAVTFCERSLDCLALPAAQRLMQSLSTGFGLRSDFSIIGDHERYRIIRATEISVGRSEENESRHHIYLRKYPLDISRDAHARIRIDDGVYKLADCKSPFGTFLDDVDLEDETILPRSAEIRFGNFATYSWSWPAIMDDIAGFSPRYRPTAACLRLQEPRNLPVAERKNRWPNFMDAARIVFILLGSGVVIGSHPDCRLLIDGPHFPARVAVIYPTRYDICMIRRVDATIPLRVDGVSLEQETFLTDKSTITIGNLQFHINTSLP